MPMQGNISYMNCPNMEQGRIHGYLSRVRLGRGSNESLQASKQQKPRSKIDVTDGPTDRRTDIASYRVACTRLKTRDSLANSDSHWPFLPIMTLGFGSQICGNQIRSQNVKGEIISGFWVEKGQESR